MPEYNGVEPRYSGMIYLPSIIDIQRELNRRGADLKVDGRCGVKTLTAWEYYYCMQQGIESCKKAGMK